MLINFAFQLRPLALTKQISTTVVNGAEARAHAQTQLQTDVESTNKMRIVSDSSLVVARCNDWKLATIINDALKKYPDDIDQLSGNIMYQVWKILHSF